MKLGAVLRMFPQLSKCCKGALVCPVGIQCKNHWLGPVGRAKCCPCTDHCDYLFGSGAQRPGCQCADVSKRTEVSLRLGFGCTFLVASLCIWLYCKGAFSSQCDTTEKVDVNGLYTRAIRNNYSR